MSGIQRRGGALLLAVLTAALGTALLTGTITPTQAGWTDQSLTAATMVAGSWHTAPAIGCVAMTPTGEPRPDGRCTVASISYNEWGTPGNRTRGYSVALNSDAGNGFIRLTIDLSAGTGSNSDFSWSTAGLISNGQATGTDDWTCADLPILTADTPSNWGWGPGSSIYFQVTENGARDPLANC